MLQNAAHVQASSRVLTKYFQTEVCGGCTQSRLCHFNGVAVGIVKRHI